LHHRRILTSQRVIKAAARKIEQHAVRGELGRVQAVVGVVQHAALCRAGKIRTEVIPALGMPAHLFVTPLRCQLCVRAIGTAKVQATAGILLQTFRDALLVAEDVNRLPQQTEVRLDKESIVPQPPVILRGCLGQKADSQVGAQLRSIAA
jgi:hypothetical protein